MLPESSPDAQVTDTVTEIPGKMSSQFEEDKLMHSVLENDKETIDNGKLVTGMINHGISFTPDMTFEKLVKDYANTEKVYGKTILRQLTGYDPNFLKKNIRLPEFKRELKESIQEQFENLKKKGIIDKEGNVTDEGIKLSSLILYVDELEALKARGWGMQSKKSSAYGDKADERNYQRGDVFRNIAMKRSLKTAARRQHPHIEVQDLQSVKRKSKGRINVVYAFDSSGSMKGKKLEMAKKAGIALMHRAISNKDKVGLVVFKTKVKDKVPPTDDFHYLLKILARTRAGFETNITAAIKESVNLFPRYECTRHLILLTDAMPTVGKKPEKETLEAAGLVQNAGVTISLIGINLTEEGKELAQKITEIGNGKFYVVKDLEELDQIVLKDYGEL